VPWYALYNAVLALGCRAIQMTESVESPSSFQDSENVAWQYFQNAFSVHMDLLYHKSNFTAIQARPYPISFSSLFLSLPPPLTKSKLRFEADEWFVGADCNGQLKFCPDTFEIKNLC
jgi:hypothetical protein